MHLCIYIALQDQKLLILMHPKKYRKDKIVKRRSHTLLTMSAYTGTMGSKTSVEKYTTICFIHTHLMSDIGRNAELPVSHFLLIIKKDIVISYAQPKVNS